jgi:hypothetical protein
MKRTTLILALLAIGVSIAGCGYHQGSPAGSSDAKTGAGGDAGGSGSGKGEMHWSSIYRADVNTVAVPIFKNNDFQRGVEFALTKALVNQIEARTPYKVVPRERADTIIEGEIVQVRVNTLSKDSKSAVPQDQLLTLMVDFTWKDLKTGRILVSRRGLEKTSSFYPTLGEGRWVGTQQATEEMAITIVNELQADW